MNGNRIVDQHLRPAATALDNGDVVRVVRISAVGVLCHLGPGNTRPIIAITVAAVEIEHITAVRWLRHDANTVLGRSVIKQSKASLLTGHDIVGYCSDRIAHHRVGTGRQCQGVAFKIEARIKRRQACNNAVFRKREREHAPSNKGSHQGLHDVSSDLIYRTTINNPLSDVSTYVAAPIGVLPL